MAAVGVGGARGGDGVGCFDGLGAAFGCAGCCGSDAGGGCGDGSGGGRCTYLMHSRSLKAIDPRTPAVPGRG